MTYGLSFLTVSVLMLVAAWQRGGWYYALIYPALSFAIVAFAYLGVGPWIFGKYSNGRRSWIATAVLLPYLLFTLAAWHLVRLASREPAVNRVDSDLYLSRRLSSGELPDDVKTVIDLTCEFTDPKFSCDNYFCFPILDASCPNEEELNELANQILALPMPVLIHCAQGHGRTGLVASAVLLAAGKVSTSAEALAMVQAIRPGIELNESQRKTLDRLSQARESQ